MKIKTKRIKKEKEITLLDRIKIADKKFFKNPNELNMSYMFEVRGYSKDKKIFIPYSK